MPDEPCPRCLKLAQFLKDLCSVRSHEEAEEAQSDPQEEAPRHDAGGGPGSPGAGPQDAADERAQEQAPPGLSGLLTIDGLIAVCVAAKNRSGYGTSFETELIAGLKGLRRAEEG